MDHMFKLLGQLGQGIADNVNGSVIFIAVAILFLLLVFFSLAMRTTLYRNVDLSRTAGLLRQVQVLERSMQELRSDVNRAVGEFKTIAALVKVDIAAAQGHIRDAQQGIASGREDSTSNRPAREGKETGRGEVAGSLDDEMNLGLRQRESQTLGSGRVIERDSVVTKVSATPPQKGEDRQAIVDGMQKTKRSFLGRLKELFGARGGIDRSSLDSLEEVLVSSDVGPRCAASLVDSVRMMLDRGIEVVSPQELTLALKDVIRNTLIPVDDTHPLRAPRRSPTVVLVVGVNGVGKTTTVAKLAAKYTLEGRRVVVVAADTFRAAAVQQLEAWGQRLGFPVVKGADDAKPASVVFDGMVVAQKEKADVVLIDTAGRLHTKANLMQELQGIQNSIRRHIPDGPHETLLVVDGVSGQNALIQARQFHEVVPLSAAVVTKLDGTAKGGIVVALAQELKLPVVYVGVGERAQDLVPFSVDGYIDGLLEGVA